MFFKQLAVFKLEKPMAYQPEQLASSLDALKFTQCPASFAYSHGWVAPVGDGEDAPLVHGANQYMMICLQAEEKLLPASIIRQELDAKLKDIEASQHRKVSRKEKQAIKEELTQTLTTKAFGKRSRIDAYIDTQNQWLVVNTSSNRKLEKFLALFHKACPEHKLTPVLNQSLVSTLTQWLTTQDLPKDFSLEPKCVLKDPDNTQRVLRAQDQDLENAEFQKLIQDNYLAIELRVNWQVKISFTLNQFFLFSSIKYDSAILDAAKQQYSETPEQQFDADFYIMTIQLTAMLTALLTAIQPSKQPHANLSVEKQAAPEVV